MPELVYRFDLTRPHTHLVGVRLEVGEAPGAYLDLTLPAWLPGAYKIFDNARNLRGLEARDLEGRALPWERVTWQTWRVHHGGQPFVLTYEVFQNKPEIHQGQLQANGAFLNPGTLGLFVVGHQEDWPCRLSLALPEGWQVLTAMEGDPEAGYRSASYEEFIDCPLLAGAPRVASFEQDGVAYEVAFQGASEWDPARMVPLLRRVVGAASQLWGRPPLSRYVFMFLETEADFLNGLEHATSTIITGPVADPARLDGLLTISTHEFFHLWNVKRLRPVGFGPFDYTKEAHTTALWVAEGLTEYYTDLLLARAGLHPEDSYLAGVASYVEQLEAMPGRHNMSVEEASWTTWHFGDDRWNGALNYYVKGYLIGVALDLTMRARSGGRISLDDAMREMWHRFGEEGINYTSEDMQAACERVLGEPLTAFWDTHLRGRSDFDWASILAPVGLELVALDERAVLQATPRAVEGGVRLDNVLAGGAAQEAGLQIGDVLVAINGRRASMDLLHELGLHHLPGEEVQVHFFRQDRLCAGKLVLGRHVVRTIQPMEASSPAQKALRKAWLRGGSPVGAGPSLA